MTKTLTDLANFYGSDKGTVGPIATWSVHNYTDIYDIYLEPYRLLPLHILEIGLGVVGDRWDSHIVCGRNAAGGASIRMWYDYFPNAQIYGIDINECSYLDTDRIKTFVADQGNIEDLKAFTAATEAVEFDFIFDDGSHRPDHQQISLGYFFRYLKSGGLYFIEDLLDNGLGDGIAGRMSARQVHNTRNVLKQYRAKGTFLEPNVLLDPDYLQQQIAAISFHAPRVGVKSIVRPSRRRLIDRVVYFKPESESLCVIRKR